MKSWNAFFEILKFPIGVLFFCMLIGGIGNMIINPALGIADAITNDTVILVGNIMYRAAQFTVVNFPLFMLIKLTSRRNGSAAAVLSAVAGYFCYCIGTLFFSSATLPSTTFSSILGISVSSGGTVRYPLQTGMLGTIIVTLITLWSFNRARSRTEYGFFSFISKDTSIAIHTMFWSLLAGIGAAMVWPYLMMGINKVITFIANDTTNPVNLALYGITERILSVLNLGRLIRQPFWYTGSGGTWLNMAGSFIAGDAAIWSAQTASNSISSLTGRFFTPYYVLNIFAVPGMICAFYSLYTDIIERRKMRMLVILAFIGSMLTGTLLPLELMLVLLCPLLFFMHVGYTGILFAILHVLNAHIGSSPYLNAVMMAMPGTLPELLTCLQYPSLQSSIVITVIVGAVSFVAYFFMTRIYFKYLAIDLFKTGEKDRMINGTIKAVGGIENVKMIQSSISKLTISVYDPNKIKISQLRRLGSFRVYESRAGYNICMGAASTMVRIGMNNAMREAVRSVNR